VAGGEITVTGERFSRCPAALVLAERGQQPVLGRHVGRGDGIEQGTARFSQADQAVTPVGGVGDPADQAAVAEALDADAHGPGTEVSERRLELGFGCESPPVRPGA